MNRSFERVCFVGIALLAFSPLPASADIKLPAIVGSNMVLQREKPLPIWGWAEPDETVTVKIAGQEHQAKPDPKTRKWMVTLKPLQLGEPLTMTISGKNTIQLENILVGEVWIGSGQSNMQWSINASANPKEEVAAANYPNIRLISVPLRGTQEAQPDFQGKWEPCSPQNAGNFSAVLYYFGRELHKELNIPIGLIHCSWGGSACEAWVKRSVLEANPAYKPMLDRYDEQVAHLESGAAKANYDKQLAAWEKAAAEAKKANKKAPPRPYFNDMRTGNHRPANLYNGMLYALIPYSIRGVVWYQGESNAGRAYQYRTLFPDMIKNWRADWKQGDFPFYFVQLAHFMATKPEPSDSAWAELREAQTMTLSLPNTGQAVIIDIGEANDIHPKNKQDVGKRLALWALAKDYGKDITYSSPTFKEMKVEGNKAILSFEHTGGGLIAKGDKLEGFAIAGSDHKFVWADAKIVGDTVQVSSPNVEAPIAVRYAWADNPLCNLYGKTGLPATPFRTDDRPGVTATAN